jgi:uncharacterized protein
MCLNGISLPMADSKNKPNALLNESSPYLLQHAHNPVNWLPYSETAFQLAKEKNKPVLISIGYSACHWCHVMEHESFEDEKVAKIMNENFINIKVDREERSDVDMIYMQAVQLMTGHGGWPLNCFVLPDGRPIYGGTYFNKEQWINVLLNLSELVVKQPEKVEAYAQSLTEGIQQAELLTTQKTGASVFEKSAVRSSVNKWKANFDNEMGGPNRAPKFPLPNNYLFLLRYALLENDSETLRHVHLTLRQMANGGIYDQLRGGFSRYSTDMEWKVPHFEKMLYDNAQLISLYCEAFRDSKNKRYQEVVQQTLAFVENEWHNMEGYFYAAYDADSEGEEGKYYVWTKEELRDVLRDDFELFAHYYHIDSTGYWENGNYILMRNTNVAEIAVKFNLTPSQLDQIIEICKIKLKELAKTRVKPGLDDKSITSWNAMMCSAFARAYLTFGDEHYRLVAIKSISFILARLSQSDGKLYRTYKNGVSKINGFLDDYAFVIEALMQVHLITQDESYLLKAAEMTDFAMQQFKNANSAMLYYTDNDASDLIVRSSEISDNVIPASNSQMALNLFYLGLHLGRTDYRSRAMEMLKMIVDDLEQYGAGYSNWGCLALHFLYPLKEVAIVGNNVNEIMLELHQRSLTNAIFAVSSGKSDLPLLKNRFVAGKTPVYVCENNVCKSPVDTVEEAIEIL